MWRPECGRFWLRVRDAVCGGGWSSGVKTRVGMMIRLSVWVGIRQQPWSQAAALKCEVR